MAKAHNFLWKFAKTIILALNIARGFRLGNNIALMGYTLNMAAVRITVKIALQPHELKVTPGQKTGMFRCCTISLTNPAQDLGSKEYHCKLSYNNLHIKRSIF